MSYFKKRFENKDLAHKITSIIFSITTIITVCGFISIETIQHQNNKLLYRSLQGSLNSCSEQISNKITEVRNISSSICNSQYVRRDLLSLNKDVSDIHIKNVHNSIESILRDHQTVSPYVNYITLKSQYLNVTSFTPGEESVPQAIKDSVYDQIDIKNGYPTLITDHCNDYGLFLTRNIIYIKDLNCESLGTVIINTNLDKIIETCTKSILPDSEVAFLLYNADKEEIYHSSNSPTTNINFLEQTKPNNYRIMNVTGKKFFTVQGTIVNSSLTYVCMVPYTPITKTVNVARLISILMLLTIATVSSILAKKYIHLISKDFSLLITKMQHFAKDERITNSIDYSNRTDEAAILHNQFDLMQVQIEQLIQQNYINKLLTQEAQLKSLQSQINPHFLYNALDSIYWRAKAINANEIALMVESLGSLLRESLSNRDILGTVRSEIQIVNHYMDIQKIRFDSERLVYIEDIDENILDISIPQMSIQPLVDNAINYAMEVMIDQCIITVKGFKKGNTVYIQVINTGSQFEEDLLFKLRNKQVKVHGIGIALVNIDDRLRLISKNNSRLHIYNIDEDTACAEIILEQEQQYD